MEAVILIFLTVRPAAFAALRPPSRSVRSARRPVASKNRKDPLWVKLLSTHPAAPKRLKRMQKECRKLKNKTETASHVKEDELSEEG